ncbi:ABC transporter permease [Hippea alviniae]|uniref:ABC transporter permease n=1 Tax=Hippea alviniae TaxID=1279027 RepID=UPI0003B5D51C|nr:ABC transporter permease [Hippea alviniae]
MKVKILFWIFAIIILLFLVVPVLNILTGLPINELILSLKDKSIINSILLTITLSLLSTTIVLLTGIPLAYIIARFNFPLKGLAEGIIDIPIMIPHVAAGIALLLSFGANGYFGEILKKIGITILDNPIGITIAMMFVSAPYLIDAAKEGFKKVDVRLEHAAKTLGAGDISTFFSITLPLAKKDIINGALLMWGRGIGEFGAIVIIAYHPMTATVMIYDRFTSFGLTYALPVTTILILVSLAIFTIARFINR